MRSAKAVLVCIFLTLLVALPILSQRFTHMFRGIIRIAGNANPSLNTRIQLRRLGVPVYEIFVHGNSFEFRNVEEGRYTLVADDPDYQTVIQDIEVPGAGLVIDFRLRRKATPLPAEAVPVWDLKVPAAARREFEAAERKISEKKCADALVHLKKAIHAYADYGEAHLAMGECYGGMGQLEPAEQEFKLALEQPHKPELHLLLGNIYKRMGNQALVARQLELYAEEKSNASGNRK